MITYTDIPASQVRVGDHVLGKVVRRIVGTPLHVRIHYTDNTSETYGRTERLAVVEREPSIANDGGPAAIGEFYRNRPKRTHGYAAPDYPKDGRCTICGKRRDDDVHD